VTSTPNSWSAILKVTNSRPPWPAVLVFALMRLFQA
jgi:hypothetical protein